ncbi:iron-sulfur cluster assembly scaffold protein [Qipengyuania sp.]|uniref:iron-sulfur cluster assembly scaffold protein n=1 Tax=Qipengyuania sp. TaxID=2004515 RepID=UPI0037362131
MLYTREMLALAVELADYPFDVEAPLVAEARSRSCGGVLKLSARPDTQGRLRNIGLAAATCAVGQAAAAIFARHADGTGAADLSQAARDIAAWLEGSGPQPEWPGLGVLAPARDYPARHGAILLPWKAALDALSRLPAHG